MNFFSSITMVGWLNDIIVCVWHHLYRLKFVRNNPKEFEFLEQIQSFFNLPMPFPLNMKKVWRPLNLFIECEKNSHTS
jgi:hypothetical protein